jgi:hypothetical protein
LNTMSAMKLSDSVQQVLLDLRSKLSADAKVLTPESPEFGKVWQWSDFNKAVPAVVAQPATENDILILASSTSLLKS